VTLTPARIKFLASYVLGPLAGVMSTLDCKSLYGKKGTSSVFPSR
jgi:hypothetical protein